MKENHISNFYLLICCSASFVNLKLPPALQAEAKGCSWRKQVQRGKESGWEMPGPEQVPDEEMGSPVPVLTMACLGAPALEWDLECPPCFPLSSLQGSGYILHSQAGGLRFCSLGPWVFFQGKEDGENLVPPSPLVLGSPCAFPRKKKDR